jgi:hypothetical protein
MNPCFSIQTGRGSAAPQPRFLGCFCRRRAARKRSQLKPTPAAWRKHLILQRLRFFKNLQKRHKAQRTCLFPQARTVSLNTHPPMKSSPNSSRRSLFTLALAVASCLGISAVTASADTYSFNNDTGGSGTWQNGAGGTPWKDINTSTSGLPWNNTLNTTAEFEGRRHGGSHERRHGWLSEV